MIKREDERFRIASQRRQDCHDFLSFGGAVFIVKAGRRAQSVDSDKRQLAFEVLLNAFGGCGCERLEALECILVSQARYGSDLPGERLALCRGGASSCDGRLHADFDFRLAFGGKRGLLLS